MARGSLFQLADNGQLASLRKRNGKVRWKRKLGRLAASSPALGGGRVYVTLLEGGRRSGRGRIVALRQRNGKRRWSRTLREPQRVLAAAARRADLLRLGERDALLPRRRQRPRHVDLPGGGGDQGQPDARARQAVLRRLRRARPGRARVQRPPRVVGGGGRAGSTRPRRWPAGGCSSAATAGRVYAYSTTQRPLRWSHQTGRYVYASAAVSRVAAVAGGPCSSAPTTGASTRSTRAPGGCAGPTTPAARSPARPP